MDPAITRGHRWGMIHDPALLPVAHPEFFSPAHWRDHIEEYAGRGRGRVLFVNAGAEQWALRHYQRGGFVSRFVADLYRWRGEEGSRSFREWRMLARMRDAGLPVPRPVAAGWARRGPFYTADLATVRIPGAIPLSARLAAGTEVDWPGVGRVLRRFHAAGIFHADLNAHNILIDEAGAAWLLDFDRGGFRSPGTWQARNLERLERSLRKIAAEPGAAAFRESCWGALRAGYAEGGDFVRARRP
jgi:3-deoxy-D-manno-octulosonic acid kinase